MHLGNRSKCPRMWYDVYVTHNVQVQCVPMLDDHVWNKIYLYDVDVNEMQLVDIEYTL
jgi:hypothetical protein